MYDMISIFHLSATNASFFAKIIFYILCLAFTHVEVSSPSCNLSFNSPFDSPSKIISNVKNIHLDASS